jgi:hypothetical protein
MQFQLEKKLMTSKEEGLWAQKPYSQITIVGVA